MTPIIQIKDVHKHFGSTHALRGVSLDVEKGEVVVIIGPSGSGKSTLLRCINRLEEFDAGSIIVDEIPLDTAANINACLLYTSDAADDLLCVDLGGSRIIKKKNQQNKKQRPQPHDKTSRTRCHTPTTS